jgi:hypothetical protein
VTTGTITTTVTVTTGKNPVMPRIKMRRGAGAVGMALTAWDLWRRLPPRQRRWMFKQARKHGPRVAKQVMAAQRARKK